MKMLIAAAAMLVVPALPAAAQSPGDPYVARGTEPFWSLTIDGRTMRFEVPGNRPVVVRAPRPIHGFAGEIWRTRRINVNTTHSRCNDGMSDNVYPDTVTVTVDRRVFKGCGGDIVAAPSRPASMVEGDWRIEAINGRRVAYRTTPTVSFRGRQISGNASCNRFSGEFDFARGQLNAGQLATTRMACSDRAANVQESTVLRILGERLRVSNNQRGKIVLTSRRGQTLTLVRSRR